MEVALGLPVERDLVQAGVHVDDPALDGVAEPVGEKTALGVTDGDQSSTRPGDIVELRPQLGEQRLVGGRQAGRDRDGLDQSRFVDERSLVDQHWDADPPRRRKVAERSASTGCVSTRWPASSR